MKGKVKDLTDLQKQFSQLSQAKETLEQQLKRVEDSLGGEQGDVLTEKKKMQMN